MYQTELVTPCGIITVKRNGHKIPFEIKSNDYNIYWTNDNIKVNPDGCVKIVIDLLGFSVGDNIICSLDKDILKDDGGGENALNIVGEYNDNYISIGSTDTEELEYGWKEAADLLPIDMNKTKRYLPYDCCNCKGGFEFRILDDTKKYRDRELRRVITIPIVWCSSDKDYAYEVVSFLTS